jgi:hypothetical protein
MKKTIKLLEIIMLLFMLYFTWDRFDGNLSRPFFLELTTARVLLNIGLSIAVTFRLAVLTRFLKTEKLTNFKLHLVTLGLYLLMITPDLFTFIKWNIYAEMFYHISIILLTPILLGGITMMFEKIENTTPTSKL